MAAHRALPAEKNHLFLFGNYEGFRQSLSQSSVAVVPDDQARLGLLPNTSGVYSPVPNLNPAMLNYMQFWPAQNGGELTVNGLPGGTALYYSNPKQVVHEAFGTLRTDYILRPVDSLAFNYTIDEGTSLTPLADPLFGSYLQLNSGIASLEETHVFSPHAINTFRIGVSRATFDYDSSSSRSFAPDLSFVAGSGLGPESSWAAARQPPDWAAITSAGPNNASNVRSHRTLFEHTPIPCR